MKIKEIASFLESMAPPGLQEAYDNVGLLIGDPLREVQQALICLDLTEEVMDEAISNNCDLIISHHPIIFSGLKKITGRNATERILVRAIKEDIGIYAIHTNLDNVNVGVNAALCRKLGIPNPKILQPLSGKLNKLVSFCPGEHAERVREALFAEGAGTIGNYDSCSYNLEGYGTFKGGENAKPYVGEVGKLHTENETRIEVIFPDYLQGKLITALKHNHPYEEVAYDIYPLKNEFEQAGAGMIGTLEEAVDEKSFLQHLKQVLGTPVIRHSPPTGREIQRVAVCGGSGSFLIGKALAENADIFITGDVKYHQFFEAENKMIIADAGHFETEQFTKDLLYDYLKQKFPNFALQISGIETNPVSFL
jgi:dinuclear metal center YbgI/SA1388 family protein